MKLEVITHIRKIQPDIILVHAPDDDQPDHQVCSKLVMDSIGSAAGPWFPDAKGGPHKPKLVLGYEVWSPISRPTMTINISKFIEKKKEAINQHKSQIKDLDYTKAISALADYRGLTAKDNEPAEAFNVLYIGDF